MSHTPPDSVVVQRIQRAFPSDELRERAKATTLIQRERKLDIVALFYTLSFGFAAGSDRSLQAFLERYVELADIETLSYASFHAWFSPGFVALLRSLFDEAIEELEPGRNELRGRLDRFRDVLIVDATFISLYQDAADVYLGLGDDQAGAKLHITESLRTGLPTRLQTTAGRTHERSKVIPGPWMQDALILLDLGFYDFWLFDRIDANDGWFVSRVKADANFNIVEELRSWPGNSISLDGKQLQAVLGDLHRQEIDVRIELSFDRKRGAGTHVTRTFRLVGLLNEESDEYHCYLTNLDDASYSPTAIAQLYRARWEVELLFKELKSRFHLDEIRTTDPYIIEALIIVAAFSLVLSRVIVDALHDLEQARREHTNTDEATAADVSAALPRRRVSTAIERHAHLIHLYLMVDLGYDLPNLDDLLLWASREPNPHRPRLRQQVEAG